MKYKYIIIFLIIILVVSFIVPLEHFETKENIDCYVITLKKSEKMKNIEE